MEQCFQKKLKQNHELEREHFQWPSHDLVFHTVYFLDKYVNTYSTHFNACKHKQAEIQYKN